MKYVYLLLTFILCLGMIGCSGNSSTVIDDSDNMVEVNIEEGNLESIENEIIQNEEDAVDTIDMPIESGNIISTGFNYGINREIEDYVSIDTIYTITFLDSLDDMPEDAWDISMNHDGSVMAWLVKNENIDEEYYDMYIAGEGGVDAPSRAKRLFMGLGNLVAINFNNNFYTGNTTELYMWFYGCTSLQYIDLNSWDVSNVEDISYLFSGCVSLIEVDIDEWDISNAKYMAYAFSGCSSLQGIDINDWDVSNVTTMYCMFGGDTSLKNLNLSDWNLSENVDMRGMIYNCSALENVHIGNLDVEDEEVWEIIAESY